MELNAFNKDKIIKILKEHNITKAGSMVPMLEMRLIRGEVNE